jgi:hypothetical protein
MSNSRTTFDRKLEYAARAACRALGVNPDARLELGDPSDFRAAWERQAEVLRPLIAAIEALRELEWDERTGGALAAQLGVQDTQ